MWPRCRASARNKRWRARDVERLVLFADPLLATAGELDREIGVSRSPPLALGSARAGLDLAPAAAHPILDAAPRPGKRLAHREIDVLLRVVLAWLPVHDHVVAGKAQ